MSRETGWYRVIPKGLDKSDPENWGIILFNTFWHCGGGQVRDFIFTKSFDVPEQTPINPVPADEVRHSTKFAYLNPVYQASRGAVCQASRVEGWQHRGEFELPKPISCDEERIYTVTKEFRLKEIRVAKEGGE